MADDERSSLHEAGDPRRVYGKSKDRKEAARSELWDLAELEDVAMHAPSAVERAPALYKWLFRVLGLIEWTPQPSGIDARASETDWLTCKDEVAEIRPKLEACRPEKFHASYSEDSARDGGRRIVKIHPGDGGHAAEVDYIHELDAMRLSNDEQRSRIYATWERELMAYYPDVKGMEALLGLYGPGITIVNAENPLERTPFKVTSYLAREQREAESRGGEDVTHDRVDDEPASER